MQTECEKPLSFMVHRSLLWYKVSASIIYHSARAFAKTIFLGAAVYPSTTEERMSLQQKIREDLKISMKTRNEGKTSALRVLIGEFQRQLTKELSDAEVVAIIRKLIKSETELLSKSNQPASDFLHIMESYLPSEAGEDEIKQWISANIDFAQFKNKMQIMKPVMAQFAGRVDGNVVKKILEGM
jgi:uncharacterized protein YqeY